MMTEDLNNKFLELINARPLDVHTWSDYPEVNAFVDDIYQYLKSIKSVNFYARVNTLNKLNIE